jgi:hypothetical protein
MEDLSRDPRRRGDPSRYQHDPHLKARAYDVVADVLESIDTVDSKGVVVFYGEWRLKREVERVIFDEDEYDDATWGLLKETGVVLFNGMVRSAVSTRHSLMLKCAGIGDYQPNGGRARAYCVNSHRAGAVASGAKAPATQRRSRSASCACGASHRPECVSWTPPAAPTFKEIAHELGNNCTLREAPASPPAAGKRGRGELIAGVAEQQRETPMERRAESRASRSRRAEPDDAATEEHSADEGAPDALSVFADRRHP